MSNTENQPDRLTAINLRWSHCDAISDIGSSSNHYPAIIKSDDKIQSIIKIPNTQQLQSPESSNS